MRAALAGLVVTGALLGGVARADLVSDEARQLASSSSYKRRVAAVLVLAKSHDGRAVRALAAGLRGDREPQVRRLAVLALGKAIDASTPADARTDALAALAAAARDGDAKVRSLAATTRANLERQFAPVTPVANAPAIYVHTGAGADLSRKAPGDAVAKLARTVKATVARRTPGVSIEWPGAAPTERELAAAGTRAFVVAPTIAVLTVSTRGTRAEIACTVTVRVAPWSGVDGSEKWTEQRAASASGSGKAMTSTDARGVAGGMNDCVMAVAEELTAKQVVPFLRKLISTR
ncbi:MAG: HEAT repeat domain-containing protein [Kofleriaceae bacterium]